MYFHDVASPSRESYRTFKEGDPMGNLTSTPYSEVSATLEVLEKHGVEREHFKFLRRNEHFAAYAATALTSGLINYQAALSSDEEVAMCAVMFFLGNEKMLVDIASQSTALLDVRLKAVELMSSGRQKDGTSGLYDTARNVGLFPVAYAAMLRLDSWMDLVHLGEYGYIWNEPSARAILNERIRKLQSQG